MTIREKMSGEGVKRLRLKPSSNLSWGLKVEQVITPYVGELISIARMVYFWRLFGLYSAKVW